MAKLRDNKAFNYEATNSTGKKVKGSIMAVNSSIARTMLRKQGLEVTKIKQKTQFKKSRGKVNAEDIAIFSRQLSTMQNAGIPLVQALSVIIDGAEKDSLQELIKSIKEDVESGSSLSNAFKKHPLIFDELFCSLTAAGEQAGALDTMLSRIATYKEKTETLKKKIKKALYYPIAVLAIALIVSLVLLVKVVPTFKGLFEGFGAELPGFTVFVLNISDAVQQHGLLIGTIAGVAIYLLFRSYKRNTKFRNAVQRLVLKMPIMGDIINKAAVARFSRTLSTAFAAGVPLTDSLTSVARASGNIAYYEAIMSIKESLSSGQNFQLSMQRTGMFPIMVVQMIAIGEESGSLEEMLAKVAAIYEEEVNVKVDGLTTLLEPLIMLILGVLVGGLVVAMYLPIFQLGSVI